MKLDKMKHEEALALLDFVEERLRKLDPEPKFLGKSKWHKNMLQFESDFLRVLEEKEKTLFMVQSGNSLKLAIAYFWEKLEC